MLPKYSFAHPSDVTIIGIPRAAASRAANPGVSNFEANTKHLALSIREKNSFEWLFQSFPDNLSGDKTAGVTPQVWDDSSLSVIDTANATFSAYDAKEGNNVLQFNPNPAGGWWGFALAAGNADLSGHDGFMIFDMWCEVDDILWDIL